MLWGRLGWAFCCYSRAAEVWAIKVLGTAMTNVTLTSQFFAILEANYPETVKNLIVIRGESAPGEGRLRRGNCKEAFELELL